MGALFKLLPIGAYEWLSNAQQFLNWSRSGFLAPAPQWIKQRVLLTYAAKNATWVETGTFLGTTTAFLARNASTVISIEPSTELYQRAKTRFSGKNITLVNDTSENSLSGIISQQKGNMNLWLDGHYSAGMTFQGPSNCPIDEELAAVSANLGRFENVSIFIDDVRCFAAREEGYPPLKALVDWAEKHEFTWHIEHDIFIMRNA